MKRRIFFWLERLKITPAERKAVSVLAILLVVLGMINMALSPSIPFEQGHYQKLEQQFKRRTALLRKKKKKLLQRYHPSPKKQTNVAKRDTITRDSSTTEREHPKSQKVAKDRVNINRAGKKALESLPGVGPTYAGRIIKYRKENDGFDTIAELKKIKGIGEKRLENLEPFVKLTDSKE